MPKHTCRTAVLALVVLMAAGCAGSLGRYAVKTPNHGKAVSQLNSHDASPDMRGAVIDHRFRVKVSDPEAVLSAWVIDPSNEKMFDNEHGLWFAVPVGATRQTRDPHSTVLILHGFRHYKNDWAYLMWARFLAEHGYRVVLVDLRGHGASTGDWSTFGPGEARDVRRVIDELSRRELLAGDLGVFGGSYGATTALHLAGMDRRVKCVVSISAFSSMRGVLPTFAKAQLGGFSGLVGIWGYDAMVDAAGKAGGFDPDRSDARLAMAKTEAYVLLMHSNADLHVPVENARDLAYAGGGRVKLVLFEDADHYSFGVQDATRVRRTALRWFNQYLKD
ncbi:MAG: alpha/beta fold hydrolase [Planctomycetota bacterium]